jgi:anaerobic C4-dicarboxylate transporter DcuA
MIWAEIVVVLAAIVLGARLGGAALGTMAALGLAVLVFVFGLPPSSPPGTVLAIVVAVVTAAATMQAAGGMDLLVSYAERALRANPKWITFAGPAVAFVFTFCSGTGHVA